MSLRERAIAAHEEQKKHEAEKEKACFAKRVKATETAFQERFGEYLPVAPGTCDTVLAKDGLRFCAIFGTRYRSLDTLEHFRIAGTCPDCGADCYSKNICNLADLGKQIEEFEAAWPHKCPPAVYQLTVGDILLNALQDFVCELVEEV